MSITGDKFKRKNQVVASAMFSSVKLHIDDLKNAEHWINERSLSGKKTGGMIRIFSDTQTSQLYMATGDGPEDHWVRIASTYTELIRELLQGALINAETKTLHPSVTYSGGENGLCRQADGTWIANPNPGQPRWGYSETGEKIVHIEAADATNLITTTGVFSSGGPGYTKEDTTLLGFPAARVTTIGTSGGFIVPSNNESTTYPIVVGQQYTLSFFIKNETRTKLNVGIRQGGWAATSQTTDATNQLPPQGSVGRVSITFTATQTSVSVALENDSFSPGIATFTMPQLETGPIATTPIPTNGAPVTRKADLFDVDNTVLGLTDAGGTVVARAAQFGTTDAPWLRSAADGDLIKQKSSLAGMAEFGIWDGTNIFHGGSKLAAGRIETGVTSWGTTTGKMTAGSPGSEFENPYDGTIISATPNSMWIGRDSLDPTSTSQLALGELAFLSVLKRQADAKERQTLVNLKTL